MSQKKKRMSKKQASLLFTLGASSLLVWALHSGGCATSGGAQRSTASDGSTPSAEPTAAEKRQQKRVEGYLMRK